MAQFPFTFLILFIVLIGDFEVFCDCRFEQDPAGGNTCVGSCDFGFCDQDDFGVGGTSRCICYATL